MPWGHEKLKEQEWTIKISREKGGKPSQDHVMLSKYLLQPQYSGVEND